MHTSLTGRVPPDAIGMLTIPRLPAGVLERFRKFPDLTGLVSDACDLLGIHGAVPGSVLAPTDASARLVGQCITVLNRQRADEPHAAAQARDNRLGDIEAHNLAAPGDVLVIQGVTDVSSMGSISAAIGRRQGEAGAIVDGAVRDVGESRALGYPVWSRSVSPITGKWRLETVGVNVPVVIAGIAVSPGDLVIADEVGVCFVPVARVQEVLAATEALAERDQVRRRLIASGVSLGELARG